MADTIDTVPEPGQTITPTAAASNKTPQPPTAAVVPAAVPTPSLPASQPVESAVKVAEVATPTPVANDVTPVTPNPEATSPSPETSDVATTSEPKTFTWTASEFVAHQKSARWYLALGAGALIIAALVFVLTKDIISASVIIVSALVLGIYGARQPRQLEYRLDGNGVSIGPKYHDYDEFRSFMIVPEGAFASIVFMPLKRFAPALAIYYPPDDEDSIVSILADRLPLEEARRDAVDRLVHHIRF